MIIEIDLSITGINSDGHDETREWKTIFNADCMNYIGLVNDKEESYLEFHTGGKHFRYYAFSEENNNAIYTAFKFALQGQAVNLDPWGRISPLVDSHDYWNQRRLFAKDVIHELRGML